MSKPTTFFHITHLPLRSGSIIEAGNFGRIINAYRNDKGDPWAISRELVFEMVRKESWPHLPSRLNCSFLFTNIEDAQRGMEAFSGGFVFGHRIYRAELVEPDAPFHVADFNQVGIPQGTEFLQPMIHKARRYWAGKQIEVPEFLTTSAIRILEQADHDAAVFMPSPTPKT